MWEGKCLCSGTRASSVERDGTVVDFHQTKACCGCIPLEILTRDEQRAYLSRTANRFYPCQIIVSSQLFK
jgi:hypothetical protein